ARAPGRRPHHGVCAKILSHSGELLRGLSAGVAAADDDWCATVSGRNGRANERFTFAIGQPVGLAAHTEDGDAVDLEAKHELDESLPRLEINALVVMEGSGEDRNDPTEHGALLAPKPDTQPGGKVSGGRQTSRDATAYLN